MSWFLPIYLWGVVVSSVVNNTKSLLALWYAYSEDKEFYNKFMEREMSGKAMFFGRNILKTFIPIYNIIHPINLILKSRIPNIFHPVKSIKNNIKKYYDVWKNKEMKRILKEENTSKTTKVKGNVNVNGKDILNKEKEFKNKTAKKEEEKMKESKKPEVIKPKKTVQTKNINDEKMRMLRSKYNELKMQYEAKKRNGASNAELNTIARQMNLIVSEVEKVRNGKSNQVQTQTNTVRACNNETVFALRNRYNALNRQYQRLKTSGASHEELNKIVKEMNQIVDLVNVKVEKTKLPVIKPASELTTDERSYEETLSELENIRDEVIQRYNRESRKANPSDVVLKSLSDEIKKLDDGIDVLKRNRSAVLNKKNN